MSFKSLFTLCSLLMMLSGCQVVSVKNQGVNVTLANERDSILSRNKLSEASLNVLSMTGREARACSDQPTQCISDLQAIPQVQDEQLLSTASELYLAKALSLESSAECKVSLLSKTRSVEQQALDRKNYELCLDQHMDMLDKSLRYSYAYMFKTQRMPKDRIFDNRQVQIRDFYNTAIAKLVSGYALRNPSTELNRTIQIGNHTYYIDFSHYPQLKNQKIEQLVSTYNLNFSGLRSITRRDGFGSEFVVVLPEQGADPNAQQYIVDPLKYRYANNLNPNIHQARYLAATLTAQPRTASSVEQILQGAAFELRAFDPYKHDQTSINEHTYPLAANFSAPYGLWLAQNNLGKSAYLSLIDRDQRLTMPHLYLLEPYNPNKKILVLVHGLASSPEAWVALTNDIMGDPVLRDHYQVWQVFYSTNMPILESRFQIYALLTQAFQQVGASTSASKDAVLIGHSMGGIIARLLVSEENITGKALKLMNHRQMNKYRDLPSVVTDRFTIRPIPEFSRAIFVAAPHRGTAFADRWFTRAARKIIKLPGAFLSAVGDTLSSEDPSLKDLVQQIDHGLIQNGPSDLSHQSKFIALTEDIMPIKGMKYHSIMGNNSNSNDPELMSDDIVPYLSSRLDNAVSEKVFKGRHSIQESPEAVLELRRILRQHLIELGLYQP